VEYERALTELLALAPRGVEPGLARVEAALELALHPERTFPTVHVAGTNGKGSVSAMIAEGLRAAGHRVGLYTSPHLATLTERVRVDGEPISRETFARAYDEVRGAIASPEAPPLTFFEAVTVVALHAMRGVDIAVLEVGLGGRLDATNVVTPRCCAITRIGIDHTSWLGPDLASIAFEKAGILKPGVPAVIAPQRAEARAVIEREAASRGAPLIHVGEDILLEARGSAIVVRGAATIEAIPRLRGAHQHDNCAVAAGVLWALEQGGLRADVRAAIEDVKWPGRLETIGPFLFDAAHNADGCAALAAYLAGDPRPRVLLFGAMADKEWPAMLALLGPHVREIVYTAPPLARALDPALLAQGGPPGHVARDVDGAIELARRLAGDGEIVVAGSMYLMGLVRAKVLGIEPDPPIAM
jgi:dihydrofolate synthase/folylpolyglutamate synthase